VAARFHGSTTTAAKQDLRCKTEIMSHSVVIAGALAQKPKIAGHTWALLQYLLGFKRLGWKTLFVDHLEPSLCVDEAGQGCTPEGSVNLRYVLDVVRSFGLEEDYVLIGTGGESLIGMPRPRLLERVGHSAFLLNIMGYLRDEEVLGRSPRRIFLDIDPGFGQFWDELGLHHPFVGHDAYVTIGLNIGRPDCTIPTRGLDWIVTPQPVVLEWWPASDVRGESFTTIASWRGAYGPVEFRGRTYGLRVHQFRRFMDLPGLTGRPFELALAIHPAETRDLALLFDKGWALVDPQIVAGDPLSYRRYIRRSWAEFSVAKDLYVQSHGGWISDRSLCYLASGKPVLAQETGFSRHYPTGEGLLTYSTLEEAVAGVQEITRRPDRHARAARVLAEEYFDSDKVLGRLLQKLGMA
jgi:hypothetical protein